MGTLPYVLAPTRAAALLAVAALAAACGPNPVATNTGSHSPATTPHALASPTATTQTPVATSTPSPPPVTGAYGVLFSSQAAATYTVTIVGIDGKVVASAQASTPPAPTCANAAAAVVPAPISSSNSAVYYMESHGGVTRLLPNGQTQQAFSVPAPTASRRAMFAVSPDDQRVAVVVADFNSSGASTRLYVEDLSGTNHADLFSESGAYSLWPVGWHGTNNLVLAKTPACTQGGGPFCCGPLELHVVDPATATRRFTVGGSGCVIVGPASPYGVACENTGAFSQVTVLSWTGGTTKTQAISGPEIALLSPEGNRLALADNSGTSIPGSNVTWPNLVACTWIDDIHVLSGGDAQHQPRVGEFPSGVMFPVQAQGDCAGRLPGGL